MNFDVTRSDMRRIDKHAQGDNGEYAERLVAAHYGVEHAPDEASWYDCVNRDTGTKFEVKAAQTVIDGRDETSFVPVEGRFRLWKSQTRSLVNSDAQNTAWFVFVLLDRDGSPLEMRRMRPSTVWSLVQEEGGWYDSGHEKGEQRKIYPADIF
ncbi:hypothetical protein ELS19_01400 [Halogeometricum borinquense]|uniref:PD(D/E)XK endonuclease domain-containing protein n=1 Tax=Halogeometricum borinquense TaxID=60847 RepID=A0A482T9D5_9EURY|nr:hypothetical protein [Halogeometricum borinquense]RYJ12756.1 hypothetical protein ELS19_01400 [Halogeometricum borinquense]